MKNSKLYRVLSSLSPKEWREMALFLESPYFNKRQDVLDLYRYLWERRKENGEVEAKENIHRHLFPGEAYSVVNFDLVMSYLFRLLRQFLQQQEIEQEQHELDLRLVKAYRKRGLLLEFNQSLQQVQKQLDRQTVRDADYYRQTYALKWEQAQVLTAKDPTAAANLVELTRSTDIEYFSTKLRDACLLATQRSIYQTDQAQINLLHDLLQQVKQSAFLEVPCIAVYFYIYQMLQTPEAESNFARFKEILFAHGSQFSPPEIHPLYLMAINYCVRRVNSGHKNYLDELLELYQQGLKEKSLLENGLLSRFTYHNIVGVGLATHQYSWTETFIDQYQNTLEKKYRASSYSFSHARLAYHRRDFDAALVLLQQSNYRDLLLNLSAKTLLLKIYYEQESLDLLHSHLEAMQKYLSRKRVIGYHKTNYQNIIQYTKKLLALNHYEKQSVAALRKEVEAEQVLTEREWFLAAMSKSWSGD